MEFTPRIQQILKILLSSGGPVSKQEIADELQKFIADNGVEAAIVKYTGVAEGSRMFNVILEEYKKLA